MVSYASMNMWGSNRAFITALQRKQACMHNFKFAGTESVLAWRARTRVRCISGTPARNQLQKSKHTMVLSATQYLAMTRPRSVLSKVMPSSSVAMQSGGAAFASFVYPCICCAKRLPTRKYIAMRPCKRACVLIWLHAHAGLWLSRAHRE
jgi:hypothetical protein